MGSIPGLGTSPWRTERLPTPVFWPGEFHGLYIVHGVAKGQTRLSIFHKAAEHFSLEKKTWLWWQKLERKSHIYVTSVNLHSVSLQIFF